MAAKSGEAPVLASEVEAQSLNVETRDEEARLQFWAERKPGYVAQVPIDLILPADRNPRRGKVAELIESLREFGQHRPVVVQQATGRAVVGNHMLKAAQSIGWTTIDCFVVEDDDQTALRRLVADNATGDQAGWDEEELASVLQQIGSVPGYGDSELDKLLARVAPPDDLGEPTYPLVARLNEHYDYVVVFCENETDWAWLQTKFQLRRERSYKSTAVALSHVVTVSRMQELLGEAD